MDTRPVPTPSRQRKGFFIPRLVAGAVGTLLVVACAGTPATAPAGSTSAPPSLTSTSPGPEAEAPSVTATASVATADPSTTKTSVATGGNGEACLAELVDDEGTELGLPAEPERIVSLSPATTEIVFALGEGDRLVAGSDADDYPPEAPALRDVATFEGVNVERIVELEADLVLAAADLGQSEPAERLRAVGIPALVVTSRSLDEIVADIVLIGCAIGAGDDATELTADMEERIESIEAAAAAMGDEPRVFYELGDEPDIYGLTDGSFTADLVERAGGEVITTGSESDAVMPLERLIAADPEVIVLGDANYGVTAEQVAERPGGWSEMTAVRNGDVRPVNDTIVTRPGPRIADGLAELALAIHPDLELPAASAP